MSETKITGVVYVHGLTGQEIETFEGPVEIRQPTKTEWAKAPQSVRHLEGVPHPVTEEITRHAIDTRRNLWVRFYE